MTEITDVILIFVRSNSETKEVHLRGSWSQVDGDNSYCFKFDADSKSTIDNDCEKGGYFDVEERDWDYDDDGVLGFFSKEQGKYIPRSNVSSTSTDLDDLFVF